MMMKAVDDPRAQFRLKLRSIMSAGEAVGEAVFDWCRDALGITVNEMFGQTEMNYIVGNSHQRWPARAGSMGRPYPGHRVAVIDDAGKVVPAGETGEVAVNRFDIHGDADPVFFLEYWRNPAATRSRFSGDWCRTGDLARVDRDGYLWYQGRADDVFKAAGYRIGPSEIENCLVKHPAVVNAAVVPKPDAERGAVVKAFVVLAAGHEASGALVEALQRHVRGQLAPYEYPKDIEFIAELPMTTTGKVQRRVLRELEKQRAEAASAAGRASATSIFPSAVATSSPRWLRASQSATTIPPPFAGLGISSTTFHSMSRVSPGATGAKKRALCSRYPIALPATRLPNGALISADVITPCRIRRPKRDLAAKSASTCSGLKSPVSAAPTARCVALTTTLLPKRSPSLNSGKVRPSYGSVAGATWTGRPSGSGVSATLRQCHAAAACHDGPVTGVGDRGRQDPNALLIRHRVDQSGYIRGRQFAVAAAIGTERHFAPALLDQPMPERLGHAGLHGHAVVTAGQLGAEGRLAAGRRHSALDPDVQ
jgi:hypothetical protein